ncbi:MAG: DUF1592 domain-containing protein [Planctomycetaceae bacterium]|nr:MAG: DUF1592 domain-containing protein [Planctomycetaceae bacterium]
METGVELTRKVFLVQTMAIKTVFRLCVALLLVGMAVLLNCRSGFAADDTFAEGIQPLLEKRCVDCHDAGEARGGVDFSGITSHAAAISRYDLWKRVVTQVRAAQMPPDDPLNQAERQQLLGWIETSFDTSDNPDPGPALTRQLTRSEYGQTIRDLLRIGYDPAGEAGIPEEQVVEGFPNRAGGLVLEASLMEKYFTAADLALEKLFTDPGAANARRSLFVAAPSESVTAPEAAREVLRAFLRRAFRRPVAEEEVKRYAAVAEGALRHDDDFDLAIRKAMKPVLVSPHFLLRVESVASDSEKVARINDHELAVRLSYFLWGTMPDEELFSAADGGELSRPEALERQVRRMLVHDKASSLTSNFLAHWLQLPHLRKALPTQNHFPTYTRGLRDAMERETRLFCDHLRQEDGSVLAFLDADYTFVNAELARHYGLPEPSMNPGEFVKVALRAEDHRGGLLAMASILTMTSHTDRTKPTARGKWMLEVLLGSPPPPPPPDAGNLAPPDKDQPEPASFREQLGQHASDSRCVSCHQRIDPLGFALENFDAIGRWREGSELDPIDNTGTLPGVGEFRGLEGLRGVLSGKQPEFVENLAAQTLSYALGRDVSYYDEPSLKAITAALQQNNFRFSTLILEVVKSYPFQHRKVE